jgi:hypothetical protein
LSNAGQRKLIALLALMRLAIRRHLPLFVTACFAMVWVIARACLQSVTLDEADAYLGGVAPTWPSHWYPTSGNHVLNSILMRLFTWLFGLSHVTLRAPALLGAAIYIGAAYSFCMLLRERMILTWPLFVCLVYNPFVMDHLVAARGYSLALGFLMAVISILCRQLVTFEDGRERNLYGACVVASIGAALSFCANFSFAYVNGVTMLLFLVWACQHGRHPGVRDSARLSAACILPGLLVTLLICGSVLRDWPKGELIIGARTVHEMRVSVIDSSFFELNQNLVNPLVYVLLDRVRPFLPGLLFWLCALQAVLIVTKPVAGDSRRQGLASVALFITRIIALSVFLHWLQRRLFGILLPKDRTAVFLAPLPLLVFGVVTAIVPRTKVGRALRALSIALLFIGAAYFTGSLRLLYFKDWKFDADVKGAFAVVQYAERQYGIREFHSAWQYRSTLDFYRLYYRDDALVPFITSDPYPVDKSAYVLSYPDDEDFIRKQKLKIIYHGDLSDVVVAIRE